jgi:hemerythrin
MAVIEWDDALTLGNQEIDGHHRHLVDLLNKTYQGFVNGQERSQTELILKELVNYATYHFSAEEQLMRAHGYPNCAAHEKLHQEFIAKVNTCQKEFAAGRQTLPLELIVLLRDWIFDHIMQRDREFQTSIKPEADQKGTQGASIHLV